METRILASNMHSLARQRNLLGILMMVMMLSNLLLALRLITTREKVILVPSLHKELEIASNKVSKNYIEEMAIFYLSNLLDVTNNDVQYKRERILKYTTSSSAKTIIEYFAGVMDEYKKFDLATHFTPIELEIDIDNLEIIAKGMLTAWYGKKGYETTEVKYRLVLEYVGNILKLKEFGKLVEDKK